MIQPDPRFLGFPVALDVADGAEVLHQLRDLGLQRQALDENLHLGTHAWGVWVRPCEATAATTTAASSPTTATAAESSAATPTSASKTPISHSGLKVVLKS